MFDSVKVGQYIIEVQRTSLGEYVSKVKERLCGHYKAATFHGAVYAASRILRGVEHDFRTLVADKVFVPLNDKELKGIFVAQYQINRRSNEWYTCAEAIHLDTGLRANSCSERCEQACIDILLRKIGKAYVGGALVREDEKPEASIAHHDPRLLDNLRVIGHEINLNGVTILDKIGVNESSGFVTHKLVRLEDVERMYNRNKV